MCVAKPGAKKNCKQTPVRYEIPSANRSFLKAYMILKANRLQLLIVIPNINTISDARSQLTPYIQEAPMAASEFQLHMAARRYKCLPRSLEAEVQSNLGPSRQAFLSSQSGSRAARPFTTLSSRRYPSLPLALYFFGSASLQGSYGNNKRGPWKDQKSRGGWNPNRHQQKSSTSNPNAPLTHA